MRVAVIGAGVGGLTLGVALRRAGVEVSVHERSTTHRAGNGLGLAANGVRVLAGLGLGPALERIGAPIPGMRLRSQSGRGLADYDLGPSGLLGVRRLDLAAVLVDALPDGVVHHGQTSVGVRSDDHAAVVAFADGTEIVADVIVGADGIRSTVAEYVTDRPPPRDSGRVVHRGFAPASGLPPELTTAQSAWLGSDRHFLAYPVGADRSTLVVAGFAPRGQDTRRPGALAGAFAAFSPEVVALTDRAEEVTVLDLVDRDPIAPWARGRVCLLGDAAHAMLPHTGQGANQAIEDAAVLAAVLGSGRPGDEGEIERRLLAYQAARRPRTERVQAQSRRNGELFSGGMASSVDAGRAPERPDLSWLYGYDALDVGRRVAADVLGG